MTQLRLALAALLALPLAACIIPIPVPNGTPGSVVVYEGDACGARRLQDYVGQTEATVRAIRFQSPVPVRIVSPSSPASGPADPNRLNFVINAAGLVETVGCG